MDSPKITYKYYTNPAFCAQSEVVFTQQAPCVSPRVTASPKAKFPPPETKRIPPLGANSPRRVRPQLEYQDKSRNQRVRTDISDNPLRITQSKNDGPLRYVNATKCVSELPPKPGPKPSRYAIVTPAARKIVRSFSQRSQSTRVNEEHVHRRVNSSSERRVEEELEMFNVTNDNCVEVSDSNAEDETEVMQSSVSSRILKHRYAEIPDDFEEYSPTKKRIIETNPEEYNVDAPSEDEFKEVPTEIVKSVNGKLHRYAIIPSDDEEIIARVKSSSPPTFHIKSPGMSRKNLEATQKLHELLATPKKQVRRLPKSSPLKSCASSPSIRSQVNTTPNRALSPDRRNGFPTTPRHIASSTPKQTMTPSKSLADLASPPLPRRNSDLCSPLGPRAQQKLSYEARTEHSSASSRKPACPDFFVREQSFTKSREPSFIKSREHSFVKSREQSFNRSRDHERSFELDRSRDLDSGRSSKRQIANPRSTAIISPRMVSRGSSSIYSSGTVFSGKGRSYSPGCATLALAAAMLALCGALTAALSFYIMCTFGRRYYLDIGVLSGFTCLILGLLGFRSRTHTLLPNRNYVSGYIVLSVFSLLSCGALLVLLVWGGGSGVVLTGALADLFGGAVSGLGALCLVLAGVGALSSCCCSKTPPDNRVADV